MKKALISLMISILIFSNFAHADCDFSIGISPLPDGRFAYSKDCHLKVGELVQSEATKDKQIADLTQAIQLKDLAIDKADQRVHLWMDTSFKLEDDLGKVQNLQSGNNHLWFGLGVAATVLSIFVAAKAIGR